MYARAVWVENGMEKEGAVPNNWIYIIRKLLDGQIPEQKKLSR